MNDEELEKVEKGLVTILLRAAKDGNTQAAKSALSYLGSSQPKKKRRRVSKRHARMDREEYLVNSLVQIEQTVVEATDASSWQAVVNGKRLAVQLRDELDRYRELHNAKPLSPEETIARMKESITGWPEELLEFAIDVFCKRHDARFYLTKNDGPTVERTDEGWKSAKAK